MNWGGLSVAVGLVAIAAAAPWWLSAGALAVAAVWILGKNPGKNSRTEGD